MLDASKSQVEHTGSRRKLGSVHGVCLLLPICAKRMGSTRLDKRNLPKTIKATITYSTSSGQDQTRSRHRARRLCTSFEEPLYLSLQDSFDCPRMGNMQRLVGNGFS